jgi:hypothetical protein
MNDIGRRILVTGATGTDIGEVTIIAAPANGNTGVSDPFFFPN